MTFDKCCKKMRVFSLVVAALFFQWAGNSSAAAINEYQDRAVFESLLRAPLVTEDFASSVVVVNPAVPGGVLNASTDQVNTIRAGDIVSGVTFSSISGPGSGCFFESCLLIDSGVGFDGNFLDGFLGDNPRRELRIDFSDSVSAFGFDANREMGDIFTVRIVLSSGEYYSFNLTATDILGFYGFVSDLRDISSVFIMNDRGVNGAGEFSLAFALDNFAFTSSASSDTEVPEPNSIFLVLLVLAILLLHKISFTNIFRSRGIKAVNYEYGH